MSDVYVTEFIRNIQQFTFIVPAHGGEQHLVRIWIVEETFFVFAVAVYILVIADCKLATFFLGQVENLKKAKLVQAPLFVVTQAELALLTPIV